MPAKSKSGLPDNSGDSSKRKPKPFEPKTTQVDKKSKKPVKVAGVSVSARGKGSQKPRVSKEGGIPDAVSRRMIRRIALFCGIPTALGMSTFIASYLVVSHGWLQLPTYAVLIVSLGWFGLGVVGVSYGVLSASWDEEPGSRLGFAEFKTNWGRMTEAWRANKS